MSGLVKLTIIKMALLYFALWTILTAETLVAHKSFDYIIVGGGTAGSVVATRLTEDPKVSVLVLEAGESDETTYYRGYIDVPLVVLGLRNTSIDWNFKMEPQLYAGKEVTDQKTIVSQGKVLGGSNSINHMAYVRGSKHDFNHWCYKQWNKGWCYEDVKPFFIKSEQALKPDLLDKGYHGEDGLLPVDINLSTDLNEVFLNAGKELGYKTVDYNGKHMEGFSYLQTVTKYGKRQTTAKAFLHHVMFRTNLKVITEAFVTKIKINDKRADGVFYIKGGVKHYVKAKKEVILSAGGIQSAKILMLSGIGPKKHLHDVGIRCKHDLPGVGQGLDDHVVTYLTYFINESISLNPDVTQDYESFYKYLFFGTGPWSSSSAQSLAHVKSKLQPKKDKYPYLQLYLLPVLPGVSESVADGIKRFCGADPAIFDPFHQKELGRHGFTIFLTHLHQRSKGQVTLQSANPFDDPKVTLNYLKDSRDVDELIEGIRLIQELAATKSFQSIGTTYSSPQHPNCMHETFDTDAYWECYVRQKTFSGTHFTSTCKMGPRNDSMSVVGSKLRVRGIKFLRVIDSSIMPQVTSGNTMAPAIMIGEIGAHFVKQFKWATCKDLRQEDRYY